MKNLIICLAIVVLSSLGVNAQYWETGGNNTILTGTMMLGTTDNTPIPFRTNNTQRMRLWNSSNVTLNAGTPNAATINQGGFLGIGSAANFFTGGAAKGAYSP